MSKAIILSLIEEAYEKLTWAKKDAVLNDDPVAEDIEIAMQKLEAILEEELAK